MAYERKKTKNTKLWTTVSAGNLLFIRLPSFPLFIGSFVCSNTALVPMGSCPAKMTPAHHRHFFDDDLKMVTNYFVFHLENINDIISTVACLLLISATTARFVPGSCDIIPFHCQFVKLLLPIFVTNSVTTLCHHSKSCIFAICATAQNHTFLQHFFTNFAPLLKITNFCHLSSPILSQHSATAQNHAFCETS